MATEYPYTSIVGYANNNPGDPLVQFTVVIQGASNPQQLLADLKTAVSNTAGVTDVRADHWEVVQTEI